MVWCGVEWCGVVWCGVVWCGVVWYGVVWHGMVWHSTGQCKRKHVRTCVASNLMLALVVSVLSWYANDAEDRNHTPVTSAQLTHSTLKRIRYRIRSIHHVRFFLCFRPSHALTAVVVVDIFGLLIVFLRYYSSTPE